MRYIKVQPQIQYSEILLIKYNPKREKKPVNIFSINTCWFFTSPKWSTYLNTRWLSICGNQEFFISKRVFECRQSFIPKHQYWIMNEKDSALEMLLLASNELGHQSGWLLCSGVGGGDCSAEFASRGIFQHWLVSESVLLPVTKMTIQNNKKQKCFVKMKHIFFCYLSTVLFPHFYVPPNKFY